MEDGNLAVLVDAKTEYTKQLINILKTNIYVIFLEIFESCKKECEENNTQSKVFLEFQNKMREVPKWNTEIIKEHCDTIIKNSKCDWIDELITAVFVSHTRILTSINVGKTKGKIDLNIPKTHNFIHKCFIDIARYFWKNSYLFEDKESKFEYQKNRRETELMIESSINETIRKELPVKNILKKYLGNEYEDEDTDTEESFEEPSKKNLRRMVMKELENCSNEKLNKLKLILAQETSESAEPEVKLEPSSVTLEEVPVSEEVKIEPSSVTLEEVPVSEEVKVEEPVPVINLEPTLVPVDDTSSLVNLNEPVPELKLEEPSLEQAPVVNLNEPVPELKHEEPSLPAPEVKMEDQLPVVKLEENSIVSLEELVPESKDIKLDLEPENLESLKPEVELDASKFDEIAINLETKQIEPVKEITMNLDSVKNDSDELMIEVETPKKKGRNYSFFN